MAVAGALQLRPAPLPSDRLVVGIARLTAVAAGARDDADNLAYSLEQTLRDKQKSGLPLEVKHLTSEIAGVDERTRRAVAVSMANSREDAAHVVLWGDVQRDEGQLYVELRLTVARPLGKELPEERSLGRYTSEGPSHIPFKRRLSTDVAETVSFIYGLTLFNGGYWNEAAAIFEQSNSPPNHLYHAICLLAQYREHFQKTLNAGTGLETLHSAAEELLAAYHVLSDTNDFDLASLSLIKLGDTLRWRSDWDSALKRYDEAVALAAKARNSAREAQARVSRARAKLLGTRDFTGALDDIELAISIYQKGKQAPDLFDALDVKAEIQAEQNDLSGAIQTLDRAFSIAADVDDRGLFFYGYLDRADVEQKMVQNYMEERNFAKARDAGDRAKNDYQRALAVAQALGWNGLADQTRSFLKTLEMRRTLLDTMATFSELQKRVPAGLDADTPSKSEK